MIAHRGGSLEAPENTLAAFQNAHALYDEMVFELDVHLTRDGQVVVLHDDTLDRTTNGSGDIFQSLYKDVAQLDAGYRFTLDGGHSFPFRGKKICPPLFKDVLEAFPETRVSVELKKPYPGGVEAVLNSINRANAQNRVVLAAANDEIIKTFRKQAPDMCSGFSEREIYWNFMLSKFHLGFLAPLRGNVFQIPYEWNNRLILTPHLIRQAQKHGKFIHIWTVDDEKQMGHLIDVGVHGIITDRPSVLVALCHKRNLISH